MTKLADNFWLKEFKCKDGTHVPDAYIYNVEQLAKNLQILRNELTRKLGRDCPININSAYRSPSHNKKVGGASSSQHLYAKAADIWAGIEVEEDGKTVEKHFFAPAEVFGTIARLIKEGKMKQGGLAKYERFVHYDVRGKAARW